MTFAVYITHPQIVIDPAKPVPHWSLSDVGRKRAEEAALSHWAKKLCRIISSDETKAVETADIFSRASGAIVEIADNMGENDRSATGFLKPEEFERAANWFFAHPQESYLGWERAFDAQSRIVAAVKAALNAHDKSAPLAFVGHGGVGTLLKCHLSGAKIARIHDQPAGGGNLFVFELSTMRLICDWRKMEEWQGTEIL